MQSGISLKMDGTLRVFGDHRWTHARSLEFDVELGDPINTTYGPHNWIVTDWSYNGTANATVWGNTTGYGNTSWWSEWQGKVPGVNYTYPE